MTLPNGEVPTLICVSIACGLQNRIRDHVNQCYFEFYDDPRKRLAAAFANIGATDRDLVNVLGAWPTLSKRARTVLALLAATAENATA